MLQAPANTSVANTEQAFTPHQKPKTTQMVQLSTDVPVHFMGIGGVGMSGLAEYLQQQGFTVSGSDAKEGALTQWLRQLGVRVCIGHAASNLPAPSAAGQAIVVVSSAIDAQNPELLEAEAKGYTICHRSAILKELLHGPSVGHAVSIGVTGTHGKTTTTGMIGAILAEGGMDPTVVVGGRIPGRQNNVIVSQSRTYAVAELDESDGTLSAYAPTYTVITNLELDHPDHFQDGEQSLLALFQGYLQNNLHAHSTQPAQVLLNADCPLTRRLGKHLPGGLSAMWISFQPEGATDDLQQPTPAYRLTEVLANPDGTFQGTLTYQQQPIVHLRLQLPGVFNLHNAAMAAATAHHFGVPKTTIEQALFQFTGMGRRFEPVGRINNALLVDDYAHHPTEVQVTLEAARKRLGENGRLIAVFQPHRYSRFQTFWQPFLESLQAADEVYIADVYSAGEAAVPGVEAGQFVAALQQRGRQAHHLPNDQWEAFRQNLATWLQPGDVLMTLGAGTITQLLRQLAPIGSPTNGATE
ncbi:MAG: UDP-N-acetylmuramate--L-alanine ligase [Candidatus Melainabacteria bacterium]|nr:UDP-N-acetylmuramate--L-alanine ligase [Candidatus Melainabacteria bacterium]